MRSAAAAVAEFTDALRYELQVNGDCMGDWVPDRARLIADPSEDIRPGDLVAITIRDGDGVWPRYLQSVGAGVGFAKLFLRWLEGPQGKAALVGQLFPPAAVIIPENEIVFMHRVVGAIGGALEMSERDMAALALIAPFRI